MPPRWNTPDGKPPPGTPVHHLLVIGPEDYKNGRHVREVLDDYTLRMDEVHLHTLGEGQYEKYKTPSGNVALSAIGVTCWAKLWAEDKWFTRSCANPLWWGKGDRGWKLMLKDVRTALTPKGHVIVFWDGEDGQTERLWGITREWVKFKRFHVVKCREGNGPRKPYRGTVFY